MVAWLYPKWLARGNFNIEKDVDSIEFCRFIKDRGNRDRVVYLTSCHIIRYMRESSIQVKILLWGDEQAGFCWFFLHNSSPIGAAINNFVSIVALEYWLDVPIQSGKFSFLQDQ